MTSQQALDNAIAAGVSVVLDGGGLSLSGNGLPPHSVLADLEHHKLEIIALLKASLVRDPFVFFEQGTPIDQNLLRIEKCSGCRPDEIDLWWGAPVMVTVNRGKRVAYHLGRPTSPFFVVQFPRPYCFVTLGHPGENMVEFTGGPTDPSKIARLEVKPEGVLKAG